MTIIRDHDNHLSLGYFPKVLRHRIWFKKMVYTLAVDLFSEDDEVTFVEWKARKPD
jgi:hypothetical protein